MAAAAPSFAIAAKNVTIMRARCFTGGSRHDGLPRLNLALRRPVKMAYARCGSSRRSERIMINSPMFSELM